VDSDELSAYRRRRFRIQYQTDLLDAGIVLISTGAGFDLGRSPPRKRNRIACHWILAMITVAANGIRSRVVASEPDVNALPWPSIDAVKTVRPSCTSEMLAKNLSSVHWI
jgi:hypothetical protein